MSNNKKNILKRFNIEDLKNNVTFVTLRERLMNLDRVENKI